MQLRDIEKNKMSRLHPILEKYNEVNAFGKLMGMRLEVIAPGEIIYRMRVRHEFLSNPLAAHGGAVSALMDGVLGVAALSLAVEQNKLVSTVEFKINFFVPIRPGDMLVGHGKVLFAGNKLMSSSGSIICENRGGIAVCQGLGTFNAYPLDKNSFFLE
jgi:uncharacterized protein (TIGR00369 family)